jgi:hypothetical protein
VEKQVGHEGTVTPNENFGFWHVFQELKNRLVLPFTTNYKIQRI